MFPGQMSLLQLSIVKEEPGKLLCKNKMSTNWDMVDIKFEVVVEVGVCRVIFMYNQTYVR